MATPNADEEPELEKLDARLAMAARLPASTVRRMLAIDERDPTRPGTRLAGTAPVAGRGDAVAPTLLGIHADANGTLIASVLIRFRGQEARFAAMGIHLQSVVDDIATAEVPVALLPDLERDPDVIYVELARPVFQLLDTSVPAIGISRAHDAARALTGAGVVIGVIDLDGLDIHHPDFSSLNGSRTRVAHLWDQREEQDGAGAVGPKPWSYGVEYGRHDLDREAPLRDVRARPSGGHGTHVTGIAAGNGRASNGRYAGVAPEAEIVFVNLRTPNGFSTGSSASICDGLDYVFRRAGERPCAVNISLGTRLGPRDGTSLMERFIDNLVKHPGRAVVVAAGNDGESKRHKTGIVPEQGRVVLDFIVHPSTDAEELIEIWYSGDEQLDVTLVAPRGTRCGPFSPSRAQGAPVGIGRAEITVASSMRQACNGKRQIEIMMQPLRRRIAMEAGTWRIILERSPGRSAPSERGSYQAAISGGTAIEWASPTPESGSLTSPGTAGGAICVANYLHRSGVVSSTSSRGSAGRCKPDLAAPGGGIMSTRRDPLPRERGERYERMSGTSMAAPHVAGLVALLYQRHGAVPREELVALLRLHADRDRLPGSWDPAYGFGRVRAPPELRGATLPAGAPPEPVAGGTEFVPESIRGS